MLGSEMSSPPAKGFLTAVSRLMVYELYHEGLLVSVLESTFGL